MPSTKHSATVAGLVLFGVAVFLYAVVLQANLLFGTGVALSSFITAVLVYYGGADRPTLARAAIVVTLVYGVFTLQLPFAIIAACTVYLSAWVTGTDGPFDAPDTEIFPIEEATTEVPEDGE